MNTLTTKQFTQITNLAIQTQSCLPFEEISLFRLYSIMKELPLLYGGERDSYIIRRISANINHFKAGHYPKGFKSRNSLSSEQIKRLSKIKHNGIRFTNREAKYRPIETVAFMRAIRSCRDYIFNGMTDEALNTLINEFVSIWNMPEVYRTQFDH